VSLVSLIEPAEQAAKGKGKAEAKKPKPRQDAEADLVTSRLVGSKTDEPPSLRLLSLSAQGFRPVAVIPSHSLPKSMCYSHLELGRQWKGTVFYTFCVKKRVRIFNTRNLYRNDT
jgi:hypothetical protein